MKIFFCKKRDWYAYARSNFLNIFLVFLVAVLVIAQSASFLKRSGTKETAATANVTPGQIHLRITRGEYDGVKVLINGEEGAAFKDGELSVSLEEDSVIEIYNPRKTPVGISLDAGYGIELAVSAKSVLCYEGITYIGKLIIES